MSIPIPLTTSSLVHHRAILRHRERTQIWNARDSTHPRFQWADSKLSRLGIMLAWYETTRKMSKMLLEFPRSVQVSHIAQRSAPPIQTTLGTFPQSPAKSSFSQPPSAEKKWLARNIPMRNATFPGRPIKPNSRNSLHSHGNGRLQQRHHYRRRSEPTQAAWERRHRRWDQIPTIPNDLKNVFFLDGFQGQRAFKGRRMFQ